MIRDAKPALVLVDANGEGAVADLAAESGVAVVPMDRLPSGPPGGLPEIADGDLAYLLYTSGD